MRKVETIENSLKPNYFIFKVNHRCSGDLWQTPLLVQLIENQR